MLHQSILLTLLLNPPTVAAPDDFADRLEHVELTTSDGEAQLIGYDANGEPIATLAMWTDDRGALHLESDYEDGYASTVVLDGGEWTEATLPDPVLAERAAVIVDLLHDPAIPQKGPKAQCAKKLAMAGALCAPLIAANPIGVAIGITCPYWIVEAWCKCAPILGLNKGADVCD